MIWGVSPLFLVQHPYKSAKSSTVRFWFGHVHQSNNELPKWFPTTADSMLQHAGQVFQFIACVAFAYRYLDMDFDQESSHTNSNNVINNILL